MKIYLRPLYLIIIRACPHNISYVITIHGRKNLLITWQPRHIALSINIKTNKTITDHKPAIKAIYIYIYHTEEYTLKMVIKLALNK